MSIMPLRGLAVRPVLRSGLVTVKKGSEIPGPQSPPRNLSLVPTAELDAQPEQQLDRYDEGWLCFGLLFRPLSLHWGEQHVPKKAGSVSSGGQELQICAGVWRTTTPLMPPAVTKDCRPHPLPVPGPRAPVPWRADWVK